MIRSLFLLLILLISNEIVCQPNPNYVSLNSLRKHLTIIASDDMEGRETGTKGLQRAASYIQKEFKDIGLTTLNHSKGLNQWYKIPKRLKKVCNVIGCIEGSSKKDEFIVISAHYDHLGMVNGDIYNGADDNGSGTSALISLAEAIMLKKINGNSPQRTIVFIAFSGEEKGLWGSRYFTSHPLIPLEKISCNINMDMIGRVDPDRLLADSLNYIHVVGENRVSSEIKPIINSLNDSKYRMTLDSKYNDENDANRIFYRSDHYNFARKKVPIMFFFDGMLGGDYHETTDDVDKINWNLYYKRVNFIYDLCEIIDNKEEMLKRDIK